MPPFRVLHALHDYLPRHQAGSELYVEALAAAQARAGDYPAVLAAEFDPARGHGQVAWRRHQGVPVAEVVNNWHHRTFAETYRPADLGGPLGHVLDAVQPHVLHVHNLLNLSFDLPSLARARGIPVVATLPDYTLVCPSGGQRIHRAEAHVCRTIEPARCARCFPDSPFHQQWRYGRLAARTPAGLAGRVAGALRRHFPGAAGAAQAVLSHTPGTVVTPGEIESRLSAAREALAGIDLAVAPSRRLAGEYGALGLAPDRLIVSDYGFAPLAPARRTEPDGTLRIGYAGTVVWHKGVDVLVAAARLLPRSPIEVRIYGDTGTFPDYSGQLAAEASGLPVRFMGRFAHDEVARVLSEIDVLVVPSRWPENSPLVVHEAFMARVPVIGSAIGGLEDLLDGPHRILVPPSDPAALAGALAALAETPSRLAGMAAAAPAVKSIDQDAREWADRYAAVIARRPLAGAR